MQLRVVFLLAALLVIPAAALAFQPPAKPEATATTDATTADAAPLGDIERGKKVFQTVGNCSYCHGWAGDGEHGKHPRSPGVAANLRESTLDTESMLSIVRCGIPGTAMPYHVAAAYKDPEICFGMMLADFGTDGGAPARGKTFREKDVVNVVAYIQAKMQGQPLDLAWCEDALKPGDSQCNFLKP